MKLININNISNNMEDFILAKIDIEKHLIAEGKIKEKYTLTDFLSKLDLTKSAFLNNGDIIPFKIINSKTERYLLYALTETKDNIKTLDILTKKLADIRYDFTKLTKKTAASILLEELDTKPYFIINNEFFI